QTLVQLLVAVSLLALVWLSFGQNVLSPPEPVGAPEQFGGLRLTSSTTGPEALSRVNRLHGTEINLVSAYVAEYALSYQQGVTAWVGQAASPHAAAELLELMVAGISRGSTGFSGLQSLSVSGQTVFQVSGPGGEHYFYLAPEPGSRVIWLTITADDSRSILEQAVKTF
ncbi:MAG: hypothetical protein Q8R28_03875, partial [Dehalococcoidia bacterium]|nr:hypothetical protein [Dehalococcoidia bacterium]